MGTVAALVAFQLISGAANLRVAAPDPVDHPSYGGTVKVPIFQKTFQRIAGQHEILQFSVLFFKLYGKDGGAKVGQLNPQ